MRKLSEATLALLITTILMSTILRICTAQTTTIDVKPKKSYPSVGQSFAVNVSITNVINLHAWQLRMTFNPEIIRCENISMPEDNIFGGLAQLIYVEINNTRGDLLAYCYIDSPSGVNASGTLCQTEFNCKAPGITPIVIADRMQLGGTYLVDPDSNLIPFQAADGMAEVGGPNFQENIFTVSQDTETYYVIVFSNSTVTAFNFDQLYKEMTFDASGESGTIGSSSTAFSKELLNGTIAVLVNGKAVYYSLFENTTHNFLCFKYEHTTKTIKVRLTVLADVNGDRKVNIVDIFIVILAFGSNPTHPKWNPLADLNHDNQVNVVDMFIAIQNFGEEWRP